jgi:hypothetical protein
MEDRVQTLQLKMDIYPKAGTEGKFENFKEQFMISTLGSTSNFARIKEIAHLSTLESYPDIDNKKLEEYANNNRDNWELIKEKDVVNGVIEECGFVKKETNSAMICTLDVIDSIYLEQFWSKIAILIRLPLLKVYQSIK